MHGPDLVAVVAVRDRTPGSVHVVGVDGGDHLVGADLQGREPVRVELHHHLFLVTAVQLDCGHAGKLLERALHVAIGLVTHLGEAAVTGRLGGIGGEGRGHQGQPQDGLLRRIVAQHDGTFGLGREPDAVELFAYVGHGLAAQGRGLQGVGLEGVADVREGRILGDLALQGLHVQGVEGELVGVRLRARAAVALTAGPVPRLDGAGHVRREVGGLAALGQAVEGQVHVPNRRVLEIDRHVVEEHRPALGLDRTTGPLEGRGHVASGDVGVLGK